MRSLEEIELLDIENDEKYQNYYNKLINTLNQTTIENSIIFEFEIKENICLCKIEKYEVNGSHQMIQTQEFSKIEKVIDRIIKPFLSVFNKKNKIIIHTITPTHGTKSNLKLITENNDMCNIKNLEDKTIIELSEKIDQDKESEQKIDEHGVGNVLAFILSLIIVGIILLNAVSILWK